MSITVQITSRGLNNLMIFFSLLFSSITFVFAASVDYNDCNHLTFSERNACLLELSRQQENRASYTHLLPSKYRKYFESTNKMSTILFNVTTDYGMILEGRSWSTEGQYFANRNNISGKWLSRKGTELGLEYNQWSIRSTGVQMPSETFWGRPGIYTLIPILNNNDHLWRLGGAIRIPIVSGNIGGLSERFRVWRLSIKSDYQYRIDTNWDFNLENNLIYESEYATSENNQDYIYQRPMLIKIFPAFSYFYGSAIYKIGYKHWLSITKSQHFLLSNNQTMQDNGISFGGLETSARYLVSNDLWLNIGLGLNVIYQEEAHLRTDVLAEDLNELSSIRINIGIEKAF